MPKWGSQQEPHMDLKDLLVAVGSSSAVVVVGLVHLTSQQGRQELQLALYFVAEC